MADIVEASSEKNTEAARERQRLIDEGLDPLRPVTREEATQAEEPVEAKLWRLERLEASKLLADYTLSYHCKESDSVKLNMLRVIFE